MKICPKCSTEYPDDKKFCKKCRVQLLSSENILPELLSYEVNAGQGNKTEPINIDNYTSIVKKKKRYIIPAAFIAICTIAAVFIIKYIQLSNEKGDIEITRIDTELNSVNPANTNISSETVKDCLLEWHNSLGNIDYDNNIKYYAKTVKYFNKTVNKNYIIKEKERFFIGENWRAINNDISDIRIVPLNDNEIKTYFNYDCTFIKNTGRVYSVNVDKVIIWNKIDGYWRIVEERDIKLISNRSHK